MGSFATVADLEARTGQELDATPEAEAMAEEALRGATAAIKAYTRQTIELVTNDVVTLHGNWGSFLRLPQRPVLAIHSVLIKNGSVFVDEIPLNVDTDYRWDRFGQLRRVSYVTGRLLAPASAFWGGVHAVVEVDYDHGYADIPEDIRDICLSVAVRRLGSPDEAKSETIGNYAVTYAEAVKSLEPDEKEALDDYRRSGRVGMLQT